MQGFRLCGGDQRAMETDEVRDRPLETFGAATFGVICGLTFSLHGESRLRAQESAVIINRKEVILCSVILPSSSSF